MDKRSIIGYILIGFVLIGYFMLNQPSPEDIARQQRYNDSIALVEKGKQLAEKAQEQLRLNEIEEQKKDSSNILFNALNGTEETITLSNEYISVDLSTLGGCVSAVTLKEYNDQQGKPLVMFDKRDKAGNFDSNTINFIFEGKQGVRNIATDELYFTPMVKGGTEAAMRLSLGEERYIEFTYRLNGYMLDMHIDAKNMDDILSSRKSAGIEWRQLARQHEPGYEFEQRFTSLTYKPVDDDSDYLSEMQDDSEKFTEPMKWIACKNQFFSCIMIAGEDFSDVSLDSKKIEKGQNMLKSFSANMNVPFDPTGVKATGIQFYFGPNKFGTLQECSSMSLNAGDDLELEEIIYFGWPIVRWINRYFIMYLFDGLSGLGLNMGLVLILLTIIIKTIVYPFTKKSYVSSAKMRALKPYIDEINAKYTKKEDALKKQQEIMGLYSKYGASPMGGCLPMLIQMPVFIALFNFVPNAIELRQESFLWANDLSAFDSIISWNQPIWLIGNHISLFCLLFCVTQIVNTYYTSKMQPSMGSSEMEQQQKMMRWMMYLMPVIFFFMFNDYSSGLNFYYFVSTLISVGIFIYLRRAVKEDELLKKMEAYAESNKNNPAKKSNMMARLEALQEQQRRLAEEQEKMRKARNGKK